MRLLKKRYGLAKLAFMDIDFDGKGYITKSDFDRCVMGLNLPYSVDQINQALGDDSMLTQSDM